MKCGSGKAIQETKKMLIVIGPGNSGKSTSIKLAYQLILERVLSQNAPTQAIYLYSTTKTREVAVHLALKISLGIATRGDTGLQVWKGLKFFENQHSKVIVCATRTSGGSLAAARAFAKSNGFAVTEMQKVKISLAQQVDANSKFAKKIHKWARDSLGV